MQNFRTVLETEERLRDSWKLYLQQEPFRILRERYPERLKKLIVIAIVFHMAANVKFDLSLKNAVKTNTVGTVNIVALAKQVNARYKLPSKVRSIWHHNVRMNVYKWLFQYHQLFISECNLSKLIDCAFQSGNDQEKQSFVMA